MNEIEKQKVLDFFNESDQLDILDPDGICSFIRFTSAQSKITNKGKIYFRFDLTLDPNGEEFEDVFSITCEKVEIVSSENGLTQEFQDLFYKEFIQWIRDYYYDSYE